MNSTETIAALETRHLKQAITAIILIIAVGFVGFWLFSSASNRQLRLLKTSNTLAQVKSSIRNFHAEYDRYPQQPVSGGDLVGETSGNGLIPALLGHDTVANPRLLNFLDMIRTRTEADKRKDGLHLADAANPRLLDAWGNPFYVALDTDGDQQIADPNPANKTALRECVIVWSAGPDGDKHTWADNITTWASGVP